MTEKDVDTSKIFTIEDLIKTWFDKKFFIAGCIIFSLFFFLSYGKFKNYTLSKSSTSYTKITINDCCLLKHSYLLNESYLLKYQVRPYSFTSRLISNIVSEPNLINFLTNNKKYNLDKSFLNDDEIKKYFTYKKFGIFSDSKYHYSIDINPINYKKNVLVFFLTTPNSVQSDHLLEDYIKYSTAKSIAEFKKDYILSMLKLRNIYTEAYALAENLSFNTPQIKKEDFGNVPLFYLGEVYLQNKIYNTKLAIEEINNLNLEFTSIVSTESYSAHQQYSFLTKEYIIFALLSGLFFGLFIITIKQILKD